MSVRFLVDAQLPPALARELLARGVPARHVNDLGWSAVPDTQIWDEALRSGEVIATKDEDFAHRQTQSQLAPQVVWVRLGNQRTMALVSKFVALLPAMLVALERGERLVEVLEATE